MQVEEEAFLPRQELADDAQIKTSLIPNAEIRAKPRDMIAFWISGLINNFGYVVMLSAAFDMLPSDLSPAIVLLADILPSFLVQLTAPWFVHRFTYPARVITAVVLAILSFLIPAIFENVGIKLIGVAFASVSAGFGEITFLSYSSHFHKNTVSAWSSGTGGAGILGSVSYLGLRYFFSSEITLIVSCPLPLIMLVCFFFIMTKPMYAIENVINATETKKSSLPFNTKLLLMAKLLPFMIPLATVYFGEYLINQAIDPVLRFPNSRIGKDKREYALYQVGVFVSRSSVNLLPIKNIYLLQLPAIFQIMNALFLSFVAIYDFIPSIYIIFVIIFWEGLLGGAIYVNTFYLMSQRFQGAEKEFCLGATSQSYGASITLAALVGIGYTPLLQKYRNKMS